jgi:hypothetical protein
MIVLIGIIAGFLVSLSISNNDSGFGFFIFMIACLFFGFLMIVFMHLIFSPILEISKRACLMEDKNLFGSLKRGFGLFIKKPIHIPLMGIIIMVIMFGVNMIMYPINSLFSMFGFMLMMGMSVIFGGLPGTFSPESAVGDPSGFVFLMILIYFFVAMIPIAISASLIWIIQSGLWTLTYRQVTSQEEGVDIDDAEAAAV